MSRRWLFVSVELVLLLLFLSGCQGNRSGRSESVVLGEYGSLTGSTATFGQSTHKGIELALSELNAKGGVLGKKIELRTEDDASRTEETAAVVQKLITRDNVVALLGEVASSRSIVGGNIAETSQVPMVTPASTNPKVTQGKKWVFRVCFVDTFQGEALAHFCREHLKAKTAAILKDRKNEYSVGLAEFFAKTFTQLGGTIVAEENYQEGDVDFKPQLMKIKSQHPDVIFSPCYYTECGLILKQARRELGLLQPFIGGDGWDSASLLKQIRGDLEGKGVYFGNHFSASDTREEVAHFVKKFKKKYHTTPDAMAALGYDAARIVVNAIQRAGSTDREKVREALQETKGFQGVTGKITIDAQHNALKPLLVLQMRGGKTEVVASVAPQS